MLRIFACFGLLALLCANAGCELTGWKNPGYKNQNQESHDVSLWLTNVAGPDEQPMLTLIVSNLADHDAHVQEIGGEPDLNVIAKQGDETVELHTKPQWRHLLTGAGTIVQQPLPEGEMVQYSVDLFSDYLDSLQGNTFQHLGAFYHSQPIQVWVTMPDPDHPQLGPVRKSNVISLDLSHE